MQTQMQAKPRSRSYRVVAERGRDAVDLVEVVKLPAGPAPTDEQMRAWAARLDGPDVRLLRVENPFHRTLYARCGQAVDPVAR